MVGLIIIATLGYMVSILLAAMAAFIAVAIGFRLRPAHSVIARGDGDRAMTGALIFFFGSCIIAAITHLVTGL